MAITSVSYSPNFRAPAFNPIVWSVLSDNIAQPAFKYVFDVYVDGAATRSFRFKQRPNPAGYGMIDIGLIAQGLADSFASGAPVANGELSIDWQADKVFADNTGISHHLTMMVGEEYLSADSVLEIHDGTAANLVADPAYAVYSGNTTNNKLFVSTWPASISKEKQDVHMNVTTGSGVFGADPFRVIGGASVCYDHGVGVSYPLSLAPLSQSVYAFDRMVLTWLNWSPYRAKEERVIYGFRYVVKNSAGSTVATYDIPCISANGYAVRAACDATIKETLDPKFDIIHVLASPNDLMAVLNNSSIILGTGHQILITGYNKGANCTFGSAITKTVTLTIKEYCNQLYDRVRLSWLNPLGGRDYMNFTALSDRSTSVTSEKYYQDTVNLAGSLPNEAFVGTKVIGSAAIRGGEKDFNKQSTTSYKIQTDWLTQDEVNTLETLIQSPEVLAYFHDPNVPASDWTPYNVRVAQTSYATKNIKQAKLIQAEFDITLVQQKIATT